MRTFLAYLTRPIGDGRVANLRQMMSTENGARGGGRRSKSGKLSSGNTGNSPMLKMSHFR
jgi:hypothetical protein